MPRILAEIVEAFKGRYYEEKYKPMNQSSFHNRLSPPETGEEILLKGIKSLERMLRPKTPEEILFALEDNIDNYYWKSQEKSTLPLAERHYYLERIKSFLTDSLDAYRLSLLSECEGLVEDKTAGHKNCGEMVCDCGEPYFNSANALWRERIAELKKK